MFVWVRVRVRKKNSKSNTRLFSRNTRLSEFIWISVIHPKTINGFCLVVSCLTLSRCLLLCWIEGKQQVEVEHEIDDDEPIEIILSRMRYLYSLTRKVKSINQLCVYYCKICIRYSFFFRSIMLHHCVEWHLRFGSRWFYTDSVFWVLSG